MHANVRFEHQLLAVESEHTVNGMHPTDSHIAAAEELAVTLDRKAARVTWSMALLATAAFLVAIGLVVD